MKEYIETIRYKNLLIIDIFFFLPIVFTIVISIVTYGSKDFAGSFMFLIFSGLAFYPWLRQRKGFLKITIDDTKLTLETFLLWKIKSTEYILNEIKNIKCAKNEKSQISFSPVVIKVGGVIIDSPESEKTYLKNPTVIHFDYHNTHVKIGELLEEFNGDMAVKLIKQKN